MEIVHHRLVICHIIGNHRIRGVLLMVRFKILKAKDALRSKWNFAIDAVRNRLLFLCVTKRSRSSASPS